MAAAPAEHSSEVRAALREIVAEHGPAALSDPAVMSNLLKDLLPDAPRIARMLVAAAEDRLAEMLAEHVAQGMDSATAARLAASSFASATMFTPEACAWVVGEVGVALGVLREEAGAPTIVQSPPGFPQASVGAADRLAGKRRSGRPFDACHCGCAENRCNRVVEKPEPAIERPR